MGNTYSHSCPLEILDHICLFIDAPSDLLSVALTSKQLCSLIIPDHLHFRDLKCDLKRVSVWRVLVTRPALAMRIRTVEITGERAHTRGPRFPSSLDIESERNAVQNHKTDEFLDPISCLADAIRCMPRLTAFHWLDENELPDNRIYAALVETCPNLNDVEILFHDSYNAGIASCDLGNAPLWKLTNLTHFSFTEFTPECDVLTWTEYSTAMVALLQASPNLVDLQIFQYHEYHSRDLPDDIIQDLFSTATWPQLTRLSVESIFLFADEERFFKRHPKLERLCLRGPFYDDLVIAHLPCLKSLDIDWLLASADIAPDVLQSLEFLSVHITEAEDYRSFAKFCVAVKAATRLKTLLVRRSVFTPHWLMFAIGSVPTLERLGLFWDSRSAVRRNFREYPSLLANTLALFPHLTHLSWFDPCLWGIGEEEEGEDSEGDESDSGSGGSDASEATAEEETQSNDGDNQGVVQNLKSASSPYRDSEPSSATPAQDYRINRALEELVSAPNLAFVQFLEDKRGSKESTWVSVRRVQGDGSDSHASGKYVGYDVLTGPVEGGPEDWGRCYYAAGRGVLTSDDSFFEQ